MTELKLNDFEGFDTFLFDSKEHDWSKFYDEKNDIFTPPIWHPKTLVEFQLDHYALWMVITSFKLKAKPNFHLSCTHPPVGCYACAACPNGVFDDCEDGCPLDLKSHDDCGEPFGFWKNTKIPRYAYEVAHMLWKERLK